ncbi:MULTISPECIES: hypothetical protein [unclassified Actinoplanes]|uniref:hypothetical protein n=1 Tax=unclassified Actinoplanes TaxID=2626549 RepID=UPI00030ED6B2|nr:MULTISPECIES: hypothetical protein [unclassified Actinoplanes]
MTTTAHRSSVLRSLPALFALVLAFFAASTHPVAGTPVALGPTAAGSTAYASGRSGVPVPVADTFVIAAPAAVSAAAAPAPAAVSAAAAPAPAAVSAAAAPAPVAAPAFASSAAVPAAVPVEVSAPLAAPVSGRRVADRTRALCAQRSAGAAGSRAPPRTAA